MIGEERCQGILLQALNLSGVDEVEAYLSGQDLALTRFANNAIHQNVVHGDTQLQTGGPGRSGRPGGFFQYRGQ